MSFSTKRLFWADFITHVHGRGFGETVDTFFGRPTTVHCTQTIETNSKHNSRLTIARKSCNNQTSKREFLQKWIWLTIFIMNYYKFCTRLNKIWKGSALKIKIWIIHSTGSVLNKICFDLVCLNCVTDCMSHWIQKISKRNTYHMLHILCFIWYATGESRFLYRDWFPRFINFINFLNTVIEYVRVWYPGEYLEETLRKKITRWLSSKNSPLILERCFL